MFIDKRAYLGDIEFTVDSNNYLRPINTLPLEDYLKGVVPQEMPALWSLEALKAQAVVARSYAMRRTSSLVDTTSNQVYGGFKLLGSENQVEDVWHPNSTKAVNDTKGEVILTGSTIAETVYSSSNGGVVESNVGAWESTQRSYLQAKVDPFDPKFEREFSIDQQQLPLRDLKRPNSWWDATNEQNTTITNRIKEKLALIDSYITAGSFKINTINAITFSNKTEGERYRNASFDASFYVKDNVTLNVKELQGQNRWDTNKEITQYGWENEQDVVIIGRGDQSADALTGNVLATKYNAPILLTKNNELPEQMVVELTRLNPSKIYILGGLLAISEAVEAEIKELAPTAEIDRIAGNNRYITSLDIAREVNSSSKIVILAPAYDGSGVKESPDALTVGPYAGINQIPIILTEKNRLRDDIKEYIINNGITQVYLLGGHLVVSDEVEKELKAITNVERIAGSTRYETTTKITERFPLNNAKVFFARGDDHTDALAAAPLATREQAPIILTKTKSIPDVVRTWLTEEKDNVQEVFFLGGQLAIEEGTRASIKNSLLYRLNFDGTLKLFNEEVTITSSTSEQFRSFLGIRSALLNSNTASLNDGKLTVNVLGNGHGVGMSQYGARERAKAGETYQQILEFYYPNTTID